MSKSASTIDERLWDSWINDKSDETANLLIKKYTYLVNYHVERIAAHLPNSVSKDDIKSFGLIGLYDALNKFDPKRDLKFDTYASFRIRGSIMDGLRKEDWLPRSARDKAKMIEQTTHQLEQIYHRQPTAKEVAKKLNMNVYEVEEAIKDTLFANMLSVEDKPKGSYSDDYKEGIGYLIPNDEKTNPENQLVHQENLKELEFKIKELNDKEQMVISLFYKEELTFTEIGHVLDLTTSRISQIHKQALFKLRKSLPI